MDLLGPAGDISPALLTSQPPGSILCRILGFWDIQDPAVLSRARIWRVNKTGSDLQPKNFKMGF